MVTRRDFLAGAGLAMVHCAARAAPPARALRLGYLTGSAPDSEMLSYVAALEKALRDLGYVEGSTLVWEKRFADGRYETLPKLMDELVALRPDVIVVGGGTATDLARKATTTIPLVMVLSVDPVASGWVTNLARPGGNLTGLTATSGEFGLKRLELLAEIVPSVKRVGFLFNPGNPTQSEKALQGTIETYRQRRNVETTLFGVSSPGEIDAAIPKMKAQGLEAVIVPPDSFLARQHTQIASLAIASRLPSAGGLLQFAARGGLCAYGSNYPILYAQAATYVDKIARGARPGDLAIAQSDIVEAWVNATTATRIGIVIPQAVLLRAANVIR